MIDTPKDETDDGVASMRACKVDEARGDQYSENVMGISRERLTLENFSMIAQGASNEGSENLQVANMVCDISFVKMAI